MKVIHYIDRVPATINVAELTKNQIHFLSYLMYRFNATSFTKEQESSIYSQYIEVHWTELKRLFGVNYKTQVINPLKTKNIIECKTNKEGTELYSAGNIRGESSKSFAKGYRFTLEHRRCLYEGITQDIRGLYNIKRYERKIYAKNLKDEYLDRTSELLDVIDIHKNWYRDPAFVISDVNGGLIWNVDKYHSQIASGNYKTNKIGATGRHFHPIICMSKHLRKFLYYKPQPHKKLVVLDVVAAHPNLIGCMAKCEKWLDHCNNKDIYKILFPSCYTSEDEDENRTYAKEEFQVLISYAHNKREPILRGEPNPHLIKEEYPKVYEFLTELWRKCHNNQEDEICCSVQGILQQVESAIFVTINRELLQEGKTSFTLHDGILCFDEDSDYILQKIKQKSLEVLDGFNLPIKKSDLNPGDIYDDLTRL